MSTKKLTLDFVREKFKEQGYTLLSTEYINSKQKLDFICPVGHEWKMTWGDFQNNGRCKYCWAIRRRVDRLTPIEEIRKIFADKGYTLLTEKYEYGNQKLKSICIRGHEYTTTLSKMKYGYGCAKCAAINNMGENNPSWNPDRDAVKNNKKIWTAWRNILRGIIENKNKKSSDEMIEILGYDWTELRVHITTHKNWENCKDNYQIDHIYPIRAFIKYGIKDPKIINSLDNLQPLSPKENQTKNGNYNKEDFEMYLKKKGLL